MHCGKYLRKSKQQTKYSRKHLEKVNSLHDPVIKTCGRLKKAWSKVSRETISIDEWKSVFGLFPGLLKNETPTEKKLKTYFDKHKNEADDLLKLGLRLVISEPRKLFGNMCRKNQMRENDSTKAHLLSQCHQRTQNTPVTEQLTKWLTSHCTCTLLLSSFLLRENWLLPIPLRVVHILVQSLAMVSQDFPCRILSTFQRPFSFDILMIARF